MGERSSKNWRYVIVGFSVGATAVAMLQGGYGIWLGLNAQRILLEMVMGH